MSTEAPEDRITRITNSLISKVETNTDRLANWVQATTDRLAKGVEDGSIHIPEVVAIPVISLISAVFDRKWLPHYADVCVEHVKENGPLRFMEKMPLMFLDGPTRRLTEHRIEHALIDHLQKGDN